MARLPLSPLKKNVAAAITVMSLVAFPALTQQAHAQFSPVVVSGTFAADDDVQSTVFTVLQTDTFAFYTTSYAGGTNTDGTTTGSGGFDPILTLFDGAGNTLAYNDDDMTGFVNTDPNTGLAADSYLTQTLTPGTYRLAVSEYDNFALTDFADYSEAGNPTFTSQFSNPLNPLPGPFIDPTGAQRTSAFTYDIMATGAANPVPEASSGLTLSVLLALAWALAIRRKRVAKPV